MKFIFLSTSFQYQDQFYYVAFLGEHYGNNGQMVFIMPSENINESYFKKTAKNLNQTFKFTFGSILPKLLNTYNNSDNHLLDLNLVQDMNELNKIKIEMDSFFNSLNRKLSKSALFHLYNKENDFFKDNTGLNNNQSDSSETLSYETRVELFDEMKTKIFDTIPFFDLPDALRTDLDTIMADLESQEFVDVENNFYRYRRQYSLMGSCLFYKVFLGSIIE